MNSRPLLFALLALAIILLFFLTKWITKLPQKYERHPSSPNAWNSLDSGIDPSDSERSPIERP